MPPRSFPKTLVGRLQKNCERCRHKLKEHHPRALFARMTYSHLHPQDDPLIEPVPPAVLVDPRVPASQVRHSNHVPEFDYSIDIECFPSQDEFADLESDPISEKVRS
jgi:hypothetical protein